MNGYTPNRVWDVEAKKMVYQHDFIIIANDRVLKLDPHIAVNRYFVVEKNFVFMRPTELKDGKGNIIYEGDLLDLSDGYAAVEWLENHACFHAVFSDGGNIDLFEASSWGSDKLWVIGNIYENPELLRTPEITAVTCRTCGKPLDENHNTEECENATL